LSLNEDYKDQGILGGLSVPCDLAWRSVHMSVPCRGVGDTHANT